MSLEEQIGSDYISAMKERDSLKSSTLSFLRAQLKNVIIEKKADKLEDIDVVAVIKKQVKQRQDSISQFKDGGRDDLVEKESAELAVLKQYLPEEMSEEQLKKIVDEQIAAVEAQSMKDMGKVMKAVLAEVEGQADNKMVSEIIKERLSGL